ncbi:response regulator transcription factor, partial [Streptomyces albidus (ex Kaewkla and Franco 2022)]|uniref:response regulator transcription factor n=1 Tax=Streptomyces albidus (ex Kaewkla and Franco 2022) TaxID=722709 RepID=UPI0026E599D7
MSSARVDPVRSWPASGSEESPDARDIFLVEPAHPADPARHHEVDLEAALARVTEALQDLTAVMEARHLASAPPSQEGTRPRAVGRRSPSSSREQLTLREEEVLGLVASGLSNRLIGRRLNISEHTVKAHLGGVYRKLGVSGRAEAVASAQRHGLFADG